MIPPTLETDRLRLRPHRIDDLDAATAMWSDPNVTRFIGGKPFTRQETWARILRYMGHWSALGFGYWSIEEKSSRNFIGELGFADFKRDMTPSIDGIPELGWALSTKDHGKGFATEALQAALVWGAANLKSRRIVCIIHPQNLKSIRVAEKIGFKKVQDTDYLGEPTILFEKFFNE